MSVEINGVDESQLNLALAEQEKALEFLCTGSAPHVYNEIGLIYRDQEQQDLELSSFQKAVDQSPRWGLALTNLAYAYKRAGQFKKAERFYLQAAEEDSELSLPYYNLGLLYYAMDSTVAATEAYQTAIERPDPFPEIYYNLAQMMTYKKETLPAAARYISTYLKLQPYDEYGYLLAGSIHQDLAQLDRAKEYYDFALALAPDDKYVQWFYAHFLTESKEYNGALDLWLKSLEDFPNPSEINEAYKGVAICYANLDNSDAAISYLKKLFENEFRDYEQLSVEDNFSELAENPVFLQLMKQHFPDKY